jgi:peroxiredoxin Q/BCP
MDMYVAMFCALTMLFIGASGFATFGSVAMKARSTSTKLHALQVGDTPPDFTLHDKDGKAVQLSKLRGKKPVVVFFYPNDNSPGCTKEVCAFEKAAPLFKKKGAPVILGVSQGSKDDKKRFIEANKLQSMTLLIDSKNEVRKSWEVPRALFGAFPGRVTYTIGKDGKILSIFDDLGKAELHPEKALAVL